MCGTSNRSRLILMWTTTIFLSIELFFRSDRFCKSRRILSAKVMLCRHCIRGIVFLQWVIGVGICGSYVMGKIGVRTTCYKSRRTASRKQMGLSERCVVWRRNSISGVFPKRPHWSYRKWQAFFRRSWRAPSLAIEPFPHNCSSLFAAFFRPLLISKVEHFCSV